METKFIEAAEMIASPLFAGEQSLDKSIADTARLIVAMTEARSHTKVNPRIGHSALVKSAQAMTSQIEARTAIIDAHRLLAKHRIDFDLSTVSFGDESECPGARKPTGKLRIAA